MKRMVGEANVDFVCDASNPKRARSLHASSYPVSASIQTESAEEMVENHMESLTNPTESIHLATRILCLEPVARRIFRSMTLVSNAANLSLLSKRMGGFYDLSLRLFAICYKKSKKSRKLLFDRKSFSRIRWLTIRGRGAFVFQPKKWLHMRSLTLDSVKGEILLILLNQSCSTLRCLSLCRVTGDESMLDAAIQSCPRLENLRSFRLFPKASSASIKLIHLLPSGLRTLDIRGIKGKKIKVDRYNNR